jgi:hypothetical protein
MNGDARRDLKGRNGIMCIPYIGWRSVTSSIPRHDFRETRSLERLTKELGEQSAMLAGMLRVLKDAATRAPGGPGAVEAPIADYPNFEHLEAEGQRLLPEQLKTMLKALVRANLLRGDMR